jgi:hypothetical protein
MNLTVVHSIRVDRRMLPKPDRNRLDSCTVETQTKGGKKKQSANGENGNGAFWDGGHESRCSGESIIT